MMWNTFQSILRTPEDTGPQGLQKILAAVFGIHHKGREMEDKQAQQRPSDSMARV